MYVELEQEVWWEQPLKGMHMFICCSIPEAIFELSKSKIYSTYIFNGF